MTKTVLIDLFVDQWQEPPPGYAGVAVDVIRASTTAVTAVSRGLRCFPVASLDEASARMNDLENALLVGEAGGNMPYGFDLTNSPYEITSIQDHSRPIVLLSSSGTRLMSRLAASGPAYVACFRNHQATIQHIVRHHQRVVVVGAGTRGEFREEDQMCCAWIAEGLIEAGYSAENRMTAEMVVRWSGVPHDSFLCSNSVKYLRSTGQEKDLEFVLSHFNDLNAAFLMQDGEIVALPVPSTKDGPNGKPSGVVKLVV